MLFLYQFKFRKLALLLFLFLALQFFLLAAKAQESSNLYQVNNIEIDVLASNAAKARDRGLEEAQKKAFDVLKERLTLSVSENNIEPEFSVIQDMVEGIRIFDEKTSSARYIARFSVVFDQKTVDEYFESIGQNRVLSASPPVLIIPFWQKSEGTVLLWDQNPWQEVFLKENITNELVPFYLPIGDLQDRRDIQDLSVLSQNSLYFESVMDRYGVDQIIIAVLSTVNSLNGSGSDQIFIQRYKKGHSAQSENLILNSDPSLPIETRIIQARDQLLDFLVEDWKTSSLAYQEMLAYKIDVYTTFDSLSEWIKLSKILENIPSIEGVTLQKLSQEKADFQLTIKGEPSNLAQALQSHGYQMKAPMVQFGNVSLGSEGNRYHLLKMR